MTATTRDTNDLARHFCERTLPKPDWTHHAHLQVGLWHLLRHDEAQTMDLLRQRIKSYNLSVGVENTDTGGYHETITRFYVWLIARFLKTQDPGQPIDELANKLLEKYGAKEVPFGWYSKERLMSVEARHHWVEPDLMAMD